MRTRYIGEVLSLRDLGAVKDADFEACDLSGPVDIALKDCALVANVLVGGDYSKQPPPRLVDSFTFGAGVPRDPPAPPGALLYENCVFHACRIKDITFWSIAKQLEGEMKTTIQELVRSALRDGDEEDDLVCFYQNQSGDYEVAPIERVAFKDLPDREYDGGYGGTEGPPFIAFSERYVYISVQYDGFESIEAIPRHPEYVDFIPWPGG